MKPTYVLGSEYISFACCQLSLRELLTSADLFYHIECKLGSDFQVTATKRRSYFTCTDSGIGSPDMGSDGLLEHIANLGVQAPLPRLQTSFDNPVKRVFESFAKHIVGHSLIRKYLWDKAKTHITDLLQRRRIRRK